MTDVLRSCRRTWRRLGVPRADEAELTAELEADLRAAAEDGVTPERFVGGDPHAFAAAWADGRGLVRPRPRLLSIALAALLGAVPGVGLALFAAYGAHSPELGDLLGAGQVRAGENMWQQASLDPPAWVLLVLYTAGAVFAYAGAVAAVGLLLRARRDPAADRTVRGAALALPFVTAGSVFGTMLFAWVQHFSTAGDVVAAEVVLAATLFALGVSGVRLAAIRERPL
jgi:hypothetical protein